MIQRTHAGKLILFFLKFPNGSFILSFGEWNIVPTLEEATLQNFLAR